MEKTGTKDWPELANSCQYSYNLSVHRALKIHHIMCYSALT